MTNRRAWCMANVCSSQPAAEEQRIRTRQDETGCKMSQNAVVQENGVTVINGNKFYIIQD
ncbi:hypothetical protein PALU110988_22710 [Paenibacillus lupini]|uniref:hypothetical protein n=1 Tax=Paenibacillus lupini TaxID=1450204 RepID=UPI00141E3FE4|nr:hypothetical protein [Paenibacillus lupini]NIK22750.1 hypothetical protein [Paenibacillus lupini]